MNPPEQQGLSGILDARDCAPVAYTNSPRCAALQASPEGNLLGPKVTAAIMNTMRRYVSKMGQRTCWT